MRLKLLQLAVQKFKNHLRKNKKYLNFVKFSISKNVNIVKNKSKGLIKWKRLIFAKALILMKISNKWKISILK